MKDASNNPLALHPDSAVDNQRETVLIDHLTQVLADRLADRSGAPHKPPWTPRDHVVVGVLPAVAVPPRHLSAPDEATADPIRRPVESLRGTQAPPVLALDFRVRTIPGRRTAQLAVHCRFALYLEDIASYAEHMEYLRGDEGPPGAQARPGELLGVWRRHDVHVPDLVIEVPLGEGDLDPPALSEAQQVLDRAVRRAVDAHFARPEARRPLTAGPQGRQGAAQAQRAPRRGHGRRGGIPPPRCGTAGPRRGPCAPPSWCCPRTPRPWTAATTSYASPCTTRATRRRATGRTSPCTTAASRSCPGTASASCLSASTSPHVTTAWRNWRR